MVLFFQTVLVLFWSVHVRSEQFELQAEGRIDKVDVIGSIDPSVKVGASFLFVLSYDTQEKGTFLVRGLTIGSVGYLSGDEAFYCSVYHSSKVGDWERLRLTIETIKTSGTGLGWQESVPDLHYQAPFRPGPRLYCCAMSKSAASRFA